MFFLNVIYIFIIVFIYYLFIYCNAPLRHIDNNAYIYFFLLIPNKIKSLLLSHDHSTCALVSEILESVLPTVEKQFTYRQYMLTDLYRRQCAICTYI